MGEELAEATLNDPVTCHVCVPPSEQTVGTIVGHLVSEHGFDPQEIIDAPIITEQRGGT